MPTDPNNERYVHDFADGEYGWGEGTDTKDGYQDIIDQLEHDVPVAAPESEIEQYRPLPGRRFVAEDTAREYIGDGSTWVEVASSGPNPTVESAQVKGQLRSRALSVSDSLKIGSERPVREIGVGLEILDGKLVSASAVVGYTVPSGTTATVQSGKTSTVESIARIKGQQRVAGNLVVQ